MRIKKEGIDKELSLEESVNEIYEDLIDSISMILEGASFISINELRDATIENAKQEISKKLCNAKAKADAKKLYDDIYAAALAGDEKKVKELQNERDAARAEIQKWTEQLTRMNDLEASRKLRKNKEKDAIEQFRNKYQDKRQAAQATKQAEEDHNNALITQGLRSKLEKIYNKNKLVGATCESLLDIVEEMMGLGTGTADMGVPPVPAVGQEQPIYTKQNKNKEKAMCKYKYNRVIHKSKNVQ